MFLRALFIVYPCHFLKASPWYCAVSGGNPSRNRPEFALGRGEAGFKSEIASLRPDTLPLSHLAASFFYSFLPFFLP
jgi:hypothetical protein